MEELQQQGIADDLTPEEKERNEQIRIYAQRFYLLMGKITAGAIGSLASENSEQRLARLKNIVTALDQVLKESEADDNRESKCPKGTTWDPITRTCI